jgi:hypothetical protein
MKCPKFAEMVCKNSRHIVGSIQFAQLSDADMPESVGILYILRNGPLVMTPAFNDLARWLEDCFRNQKLEAIG